MFCWNCTCAESESKRGTCYLPMPYARCAWCAVALPYAHPKPYCSTCERHTRFEWKTVTRLDAQPIERARHDELMAQQAWHVDDCGCDYCRPLDGVSRSATFRVAQRALRLEDRTEEAEERPRLTLRVER
jgi:hypothetical protein